MRYGLLFLLVAGPALSAERYISVQSPKPKKLRVGATATVLLGIRVNEGFHVQANPASQPQLIATTVELSPKGGVVPGPATYPPGKPYKLQGSPMEIASYDGAFDVEVPFSTAPGAKPGRRILEGNVRYQACNEKTCFPPRREPFTVTLDVR